MLNIRNAVPLRLVPSERLQNKAKAEEPQMWKQEQLSILALLQ